MTTTTPSATTAPSSTAPATPRVDIVTPAYNAEKTIAETIRSVVAQEFENWVMWIVDDGSQDDTAACVRATTDDPRVRLIEQENRGASHARNRALDEIEKQVAEKQVAEKQAIDKQRNDNHYVAFLDADDVWEPGFLTQMVATLEDDAELGMAWCEMEYIDQGGHYRENRPPVVGEASETFGAIFTAVTFLPSCSLFRAGFFREGLRWRQDCSPMEDMPIFCAVAAASRIGHVPLTLSNYRVHEGSSTTSRGAVGRNYPTMIFTFEMLYREYQRWIPSSAYRQRMWYIYHHAADNQMCEGRRPWGLLLRALRHRPTALLTWKNLAKTALGRSRS